MSSKIISYVFIFVFVLIGIAQTKIARAIDWTQVRGTDIVLFYPAQMSWELLLTEAEHSGADKFREGKDCRQCHEGEERASGRLLVVDEHTEPNPIPDKPGFLEVEVKTAHDGERLYVHLEFEPGGQPDASMDEDFATKVALMLDGGEVIEFKRAGCWAACHDDLARMPSASGEKTTKYLMRSRAAMTRQGGTEVLPDEDIAQIRSNGGYLEYWQARLRRDGAPEVIDGFILAERTENELPAVNADAAFESGRWSVTLSRKMAASGLYKKIEPGKTYTVGFSIHAGHTARRFHYVSLEKTLSIGPGAQEGADLVALRRGGAPTQP